MKEALFYERRDDKSIICKLCPHQCHITEGRIGRCKARKNRSGALYTENYAAVSSIAMDPIEKKPLYHYYPSSLILSVGTWGCNFSCKYCQNWQISQQKAASQIVMPDEMLGILQKYSQRYTECIGMAYTYAEPLIWYEYVLDTSRLMHEQGKKNILVTNGMISREPLRELLPFIDALNVDVKSFSEKFYRDICGGKLDYVRSNIEYIVESGKHIELTMLLIPGLNDSHEEIAAFSRWVASMNTNIPVHFSRYYPQYMMDLPYTSVNALMSAKEIALKFLNYVYLGNCPEIGGAQDTICPSCKTVVVRRRGMHADSVDVSFGCCPNCGKELGFVQ